MAKGKTGSKTMKPVPGKSTPKTEKMPVYKPTVWLDSKQMPKEMKNAQPGDKVNMTVTATVTDMHKSMRGGSCTVELDKMAVNPTKK